MITVLNFRKGTVHFIYNYDESTEQDAEDFLEKNGFATQDCQWMVTGELIIHTHHE